MQHLSTDNLTGLFYSIGLSAILLGRPRVLSTGMCIIGSSQ